jgi:2Fe-2S ferredoxin
VALSVASQEAEVRIEPLGETIRLRPGEPLMRGAQRQGLSWPTICHGQAFCGQCWVRVTDSAEPLPEPDAKERNALRAVPSHLQGPTVRLACQLKPTGTITVERAQVSRPAPTPKPEQGQAE